MSKIIEWNPKKNEILKKTRGISFEDVEEALQLGKIIDILPNPNKEKYPNQKIFFIQVNNYIYAIPFVEDEEKIFLKTIFPSRKATKFYLKDKKQNEQI